jgi:DNA-binding transcriptional LysR family regulator
MELRQMDLNLLVVFNQVASTGSVSEVAETLGLTQPAISNALSRLRRLLNDELFVRTSRGMEPTPFARELAEPVAYALSAVHSALNQNLAFDPTTSRKNFKVAMTDIGEIYFLPDLMNLLAEAAPAVTVSTLRNTAVNLRQEMESGHVDLAVGLLPDLQAGFFQRSLFKQRYVCMFRRGHRLDHEGLTVEEFSDADHIGVISAGTGHGLVDQLFERIGVKRRMRLTVPHFVAIGHVLQTSEMIATVPERLAERIAKPFGLTYRPHPVALPEIAISLFWHAKYHRDPANRWLRNLIVQRFARDLPLSPDGEETLST